jgi:O-antigen/teichoic acid export membrane protein
MSISSPEPVPAGATNQRTRRATSATVLVFSARLVRSFGRVLILVAVARAFSVGEVADFAFYFALGSLLGLGADGGLTDYVAREIAAAGLSHPRLERKALLVRCSTFVLAFALALVVLVGWHGARGLHAVGPLLAGSGFVFLDYLSATARATARYDRDLGYNVVFFAALLACLGARHFLHLDYPVFQMTVGLVLPGALLGMVVLRLSALTSPLAGGAAAPSGSMLFRQARWFLLRSLVSWCFSDLPIVLLRYLSTSLQVSLFSLAMRSVGFVTQVFIVIALVFYPALANARSVSQAKFFEKSVALTLVNTYVMPAAFATCLAGGWILLSFSGETYRGAWAVVQFLALAQVLNSGGFTASSLVVAGMEKQVGKLMVAALVVFTAAALLLIGRFGVHGAVAALIASFLVTKPTLWLLYRRHGIPLGGGRFMLAFSSLGGLLILSLFLPLPIQIAILVPLALLSVVLTVRILRRVAIF